MKRWQTILVVLLLAFFCGCAGTLFGFVVGEGVGERARSGEMVEIVVAARPIEKGIIVNEEMLATISIPEENVTKAMILSYDDVLGKVARYDIPAGMPLSQWMFHIFAP